MVWKGNVSALGDFLVGSKACCLLWWMKYMLCNWFDLQILGALLTWRLYNLPRSLIFHCNIPFSQLWGHIFKICYWPCWESLCDCWVVLKLLKTWNPAGRSLLTQQKLLLSSWSSSWAGCSPSCAWDREHLNESDKISLAQIRKALAVLLGRMWENKINLGIWKWEPQSTDFFTIVHIAIDLADSFILT